MEFRKARNLTSHTDDVKKALDVYAVLPSFMQEAEYLLGKLQESSNR